MKTIRQIMRGRFNTKRANGFYLKWDFYANDTISFRRADLEKMRVEFLKCKTRQGKRVLFTARRGRRKGSVGCIFDMNEKAVTCEESDSLFETVFDKDKAIIA